MLNRCETGDCREVMRRMIADGVKVQMCVTSPPYWGLRDYGTGVWEGGDEGCGHRQDATHVGSQSTLRNDGRAHKGPYDGEKAVTEGLPFKNTCAKCGARRADKQIGLEGTIEEYLATMVEVFRLVREVLADDGTLWLNLGDSYAAGKCGRSDEGRRVSDGAMREGWKSTPYISTRSAPPGLKPKDLCGIPWRVAFALQADGWTLRSDIIWHKQNPMPESVTDRPTKSHEYLFLLTKGPRYFYDATAVREPFADERMGNPGAYDRTTQKAKGANRDRADLGFLNGGGGWNADGAQTGRNRRTVWTIPSQPCKDAHFATFPRKLVEPCILAGTSEVGHCPAIVDGKECGARWVRVVERSKFDQQNIATKPKLFPGMLRKDGDRNLGGAQFNKFKRENPNKALGFRPTCTHNQPVPDVVLDPFLGSGTVAEVAEHLGRGWIGIDLNPSYAPMQKRRTAQMALALASGE